MSTKSIYLLFLLPIFLLGCQTRPKNNAYVTFYSDPPGGRVDSNAMPIRQFWSPDRLPPGFPNNCANVLTPNVRWPDGAVQSPTYIRICSFESSYTIRKPITSYAPPAPLTPSSTYQALTYKNGDSYYGQVQNGRRSGFGTYYFKNGDKYEGYFQNDLFHGSGRYTFKTGNYFVGNYKLDQRDGPGKTYDEKGILLSESNWSNGKLVAPVKELDSKKSFSPNDATKNKCDRMGLTKGTEDYSLCQKSLKK